MELQQKRKGDIENNLSKAYELLNEYEQNLLYINEPQERAKTARQIDLLKNQISDFLVELDNLKTQIQNFEELSLEQTCSTKSAKDRNKLIDLIEKAHLLQTSRNSFVILQQTLENTSIITQAKQDAEKIARDEIEETREDIVNMVTTSFKKELRESLEKKAKKSGINNDTGARDQLGESHKIELEKRIYEEIEERTKRKVKADLSFNKKLELLAQDCNLSFDKIQAFFEGEILESHIFKRISSHLKLNDYEIIDTNFLEMLVLLVPQVRLSRSRKIEEQCGTLRILDFSRPIELGDLYVDVNILNEPTGYKYLEISDLPKIYNPDTDEVDRFALGEVHQPRVPGMNVIKNYSKLMILGKPGAGKSTFLQHLAIQCNQGGLLADRVVIFIRLKTFAENAHSIKDFSLLQFISQELNGDCEFIDQTKTIELLAYGRAFILMDGLDEVSQEDSDRVVNQLSDFFEKYHRNKFVVTCRIAAQQYRFTGFTYVEVADFNQEQIEDFSEKFFIAVDKSSNKSRLTNTIKFREELRKSENSQIREISVTPILLTLTCLVFLSKAQFPTNRAQLYQDGIEILLLKWDGSRLILREDRDNIYKKLSISQKIDLLTYVASLTFEKNFYFLRKEELKGYIIDFLNQLEEIDNKPLKNNLGESVLKSIEVQHGLLIERAQNIYSFSHLTFQEYFTARKYINPDLFEDLATYVVEEKRWREVFLLSTDLIEKVDKADELIWIVKLKIDKMIASDSSLQNFLCWIKEKSGLLNSGNRSFYLSLIIAYYSRLEKSLNDRSEKSFRVERLLRLDEAIVSKSNQSFLNKEKSLMSALSLSVILMRSSIECNLDEEKILIRERTLVLIKFFDEIAIWLPVIRNIARQFPNQSSSRSVFANWWTNDGKKLISSLRKMMIEHYNLGHDWGFSENQIENLKRYYSANEYLKSLLINVNHISSTMRSKIHETIMLPMADIQ